MLLPLHALHCKHFVQEIHACDACPNRGYCAACENAYGAKIFWMMSIQWIICKKIIVRTKHNIFMNFKSRNSCICIQEFFDQLLIDKLDLEMWYLWILGQKLFLIIKMKYLLCWQALQSELSMTMLTIMHLTVFHNTYPWMYQEYTYFVSPATWPLFEVIC